MTEHDFGQFGFVLGTRFRETGLESKKLTSPFGAIN